MYPLDELLAGVPHEYGAALAAAVSGGDRQELGRALGTAAGLAQILETLDVRERLALKALVFSNGDKGVESSRMWRSIDASDFGGGRGRLVCERLRARGLLFEAIGGHGRTRYLVARETYAALAKIFFAETAASLPEVDPGGVSDQERFGMALVLDAVRLLASVAAEGAAVTQAGEVWKKDLARIERGFLAKDWFKSGPPYKPEFPGRTAFLLEFCRERELLCRSDRGLRSGERASRWVKEPAGELLKDACRFWRSWMLPRLGRVDAFLGVISHLAPGRWFSFERLLDHVEPHMVASDWPENIAVQLGGLMRSGLHLGLFEAGMCLGRPVYSLTPNGHQLLVRPDEPDLAIDFDERLYLQPSFEILLPSETSPQSLWQVELVAELVRVDGLRAYRLTRDSLHRGLHWMNLEEILTFFEGHGQNLPSNVTHTLRDWGAGFGRAFFSPRVVLRCADAQLADAVFHSPRLGPVGCERLNERDLLLPPSARETAAAVLAELGVTLRPTDDDDEGAADEILKPALEARERDEAGAVLHLNGFLPVEPGHAEDGDARRRLLAQAIDGRQFLQVSWVSPMGQRRSGKVAPLALVQGTLGWELLCIPHWSRTETRLQLSELRAVEVLDESCDTREPAD